MCREVSSFVNATSREVLVFCDASKDIIDAVAYLGRQDDDTSNTSFLFGKPRSPLSMGT